MNKGEIVYCKMFFQCLEKKQRTFTQLALAKELSLSLSTVNAAIEPLERIGAITKANMGFRLIDPKKLLFLWASKRNLKKDVVYQTRTEILLSQIEKSMPSNAIYAAYTAYKFRFNDVPADYSEVYVYADEETLKEIKTRFPEKSGPPNLIVLKSNNGLKQTAEKGVCSVANIFVDLWNLPTWYAKEFLQALEKRIDEVIK